MPMNTTYNGPVNFTVTAISRSSTHNRAIYAFDNLELNPWLELNAGLRYEGNHAKFRAIPLAFVPPGTTALPSSMRSATNALPSGSFAPL